MRVRQQGSGSCLDKLALLPFYLVIALWRHWRRGGPVA